MQFLWQHASTLTSEATNVVLPVCGFAMAFTEHGDRGMKLSAVSSCNEIYSLETSNGHPKNPTPQSRKGHRP